MQQGISDIYVVGNKINEINKLKLDATNITGYATALNGLSVKQAELILSTKGLSVAQQQAILSEAALLGTTGKLTTAELEAILVTKKRNKDQAEALLINTGLITSETAEATATNVVTAAKLKELVQTKALTQAEADLIAAKAGVTLADQKESVSLLAGVGAKIKGAGTALKGLGTGILTIASAHPVIAGITAAIALCGGAAIVNKVKQEKAAKAIKEAYENAKTAIDDINNTFNENSSKTKEIAKEYAELAQGVNLLTNENKKLSTEKYERFLDLSNQLSSLYPSLTKQYDENGNAILDLSGSVDTIVGSLDDLIERQRALANQEIVEQMPDLFKGYTNNVTDYEDKLKDAENTKEAIQSAYDEISKYGIYTAFDINGNATDENGDPVALKLGQYIDLLKKLGITAKQVNLKDSMGQIIGYKLELEDGSDIPNLSGIHDAYVSAFNQAQEDVKYAQQQLDAERSSINQYLNTWLQTEFSYNQIEDNGMQKAIQEMLFNFDWNSLPEGIDKNDWNAVSEYLRRNILFAINNVQDNPEISKAISEVFNNAELTPDEKANYLQQIQDFFGEDSAIVISLKPQIEETDTLQKQYDDAINRFINDSTQTLDDVTAQYQEVIDNEYQKIQDWGLGNYAQQIKDGTIQSVFGNVDMDKRTIITWSDELKQTYKDALDSWDYDPEVGGIDTVFGGSDRFGEDLNGVGWEVAFTPILPDGTFLSQDAVYDYINTILAEAYANDGKITEDELTKIDAQGRQIGNTFIHGIFAGIDDSQNYDNNGNWAETVGRLLHFSGDFGAVEIAKREKEKAIKKFYDSNVDLEKFFADNSINTTEEIDYWNKVTESANSAKEAVEMYNKAKGQNPDGITDSWSSKFKTLWNSEEFTEAKESLQDLAKEAGITEDDIDSLAKENEELATLLEESGMSARFAATCFNKMCTSGNGFSSITEDALMLDKVLHGMDESLQKVQASKSAYDKAMEQDDYNAEFLDYQEAYEEAMQMFEDGNYGKRFDAAMEYFLGEDSYTMSIEEMYAKMKNLGGVFGENATNGLEFVEKLYTQKDKLDGFESSVEKLADGSYKFDFKAEEFEEIGEILGMTEEQVASCVSALGMFGDYHSYALDELEDVLSEISMSAKDGEKSFLSLQGLESTLSDIGYSGKEIYHILQNIRAMDSIELFDFNTEPIQSVIDKLTELNMIEFNGDNINIDVLLDSLNSLGMKTDDINNVLENLNENYNFESFAENEEGKLVGLSKAKEMASQLESANTTATEEAKELGNEIESTDDKVNQLQEDMKNLNGLNFDALMTEFDTTGTHISNANLKAKEFEGTLNRISGFQLPSITTGRQTGQNTSSSTSSTKNANQAKVNGTFNAFAGGTDVSIAKDQTALVNELGEEGLVRDGKLIPIKGGAQFIGLKRGDIIFNAKQMSDLKKYGYTTGRGKLVGAYATGTLNAYDGGAGGTVSAKNPATDKSWKKTTDKVEDAAKSTKEAAEEVKDAFYKVFDWMEKKINYLERITTKALDKISNSIQYAMDKKYVSGAFKKLNEQMSTNAYMAKRYEISANSVALDSSIKSKIKNGGNIDYYKDHNIHDDFGHVYYETLSNKIDEYSDWIEKSVEAAEANEQLKDSVKELADAIAQAPIDKAAEKIEKYDSATELLDAKIKNKKSASSKNKLIDKKEDKIDDTLNAYKSAYSTSKSNLSTYKGKVTKQKVSKKATTKQKKNFKSLMSKVKAAAKSKKAISDKVLESIYSYCSSVQDFSWYENAVVYNSALEAKQSAEETYNLYKENSKAEKRELAKEKFDNVITEYDNKVSLKDNKISKVDAQLSQIEAKGLMANESYYNAQKSATADKLSYYKKEKARLEELLPTIEKGTQEWYDAKNSIAECDENIINCTTDMYEYNNAINELNVEKFEKIAELISRISTEQEFLAKLMSHEQMYDDNGSFSEYGLATLGTYANSYYASLEKANKDKAELDKLQKQLASGDLGTYNSTEQLQQRIDELYTTWQNDISETYSAQESIFDMMSKKFDAELEALREMVNARKEALELEKDLYDYQNKIAEKTKNITTIQKQIAAYSGDTSQEGRAKLQKLQVSLEEAQKDLKDTEYDKYISDQEDMLDKLLEEFENGIQEQLENFQKLVSDGLAIANNNSADILTTLKGIATANGYTLQYDEDGKTLKDVVKQEVSNAETRVSDAQTTTTTGTTGTSSGTTVNTAEKIALYDPSNTVQKSNRDASVLSLSNKGVIPLSKDAKEKAETYIKKHLSKATKAKSKYSDVNQAFYAKYNKKILSGSELKELALLLGFQYDGAKKSNTLYKALKQLDIKGFSKGGIVSVDDIEKQVKANGDTTLISANHGEALLTPVQTELMKKFTDSLPNLNLVADNIGDLVKVNVPTTPEIVPNQSQSSIGDIQFNFDVSGCENAMDLVKEIQSNKKFQQAIQDITVGQMTGKARLNVNRIK